MSCSYSKFTSEGKANAGATELGGPGGPWPPHLLENGLPPVTDWRTLPIKGLDD